MYLQPQLKLDFYEAEKLNTDSYQDQIAYAIYEGILYYFDNPDMEVEQ